MQALPLSLPRFSFPQSKILHAQHYCGRGILYIFLYDMLIWIHHWDQPLCAIGDRIGQPQNFGELGLKLLIRAKSSMPQEILLTNRCMPLLQLSQPATLSQNMNVHFCPYLCHQVSTIALWRPLSCRPRREGRPISVASARSVSGVAPLRDNESDVWDRKERFEIHHCMKWYKSQKIVMDGGSR